MIFFFFFFFFFLSLFLSFFLSFGTEGKSGSLAEWSKALVLGTSPQGRGFESHSCQTIFSSTKQRRKQKKKKRKEKKRNDLLQVRLELTTLAFLVHVLSISTMR